MKKIFFIALVCVSCQTTTEREPSSVKGEKQVRFDMSLGNKGQKTDFEFELIDLELVLQNKIKFEIYKLDSQEASDAVDRWVEKLADVHNRLPGDSSFTVDGLQFDIDKKDFKKTKKLLDILANQNRYSTYEVLRQKIEVIAAFNNQFKEPLEGGFDILTLPFEILDRVSINSVRKDHNPKDVDVKQSSFWSGTKALKVHSNVSPNNCTYRGAKRGYGINLGFKIKCEGVKYKIKLGEVNTAPFNSMLYHRLGYHVPEIRHLPEFEMKFDVNLFNEMYSGRSAKIRIGVAGKNVHSVPVTQRADYRNKLAGARLKNGELISADELLRKLLPNCGNEFRQCAVRENKNYPDLSNEISTVMFKEVAILEDTDDFEVGNWDFDSLDHSGLPELNALLLVAAWSGNFDLRRDNTKLVWSKENQNILHIISDPGSGFGNQAMAFGGEELNEMKWKVVGVLGTPAGQRGPIHTSYAINMRSNVEHNAFEKLSESEARWMVRNIAGVTEDEITLMLIHSGFSYSQLLLAREKLVSIQKNMVETFGLAKEFPILKNRRINQKISHENSDTDRSEVRIGEKVYLVPEKGHRLLRGEIAK